MFPNFIIHVFKKSCFLFVLINVKNQISYAALWIIRIIESNEVLHFTKFKWDEVVMNICNKNAIVVFRDNYIYIYIYLY